MDKPLAVANPLLQEWEDGSEQDRKAIWHRHMKNPKSAKALLDAFGLPEAPTGSELRQARRP